MEADDPPAATWSIRPRRQGGAASSRRPGGQGVESRASPKDTANSSLVCGAHRAHGRPRATRAELRGRRAALPTTPTKLHEWLFSGSSRAPRGGWSSRADHCRCARRARHLLRPLRARESSTTPSSTTAWCRSSPHRPRAGRPGRAGEDISLCRGLRRGVRSSGVMSLAVDTPTAVIDIASRAP